MSAVSPAPVTTPHQRDTVLAVSAVLVGGAFLVLGVLGFVAPAVEDDGALRAAGHHSEALLLGVFQVSVLHNVLHLVFGVLGIAASPRGRWAVTYLVGGGVAYLALALYGLLVHDAEGANVVPLNAADNWLHLALGVAMVVLGLVGRRTWRARAGGRADDGRPSV